MFKKSFIIPFLAFALLANVTFAQVEEDVKPGILPGNPFYFLETLGENIGMMFTFNDVSKAEKYLNLAAKRLAEARALAEKGDSERALQATERFEAQFERAQQRAESARASGQDVETVLERIENASARHLAVLAEVLERVPEQAKEAIQNAMQRSAEGRERAMEAVSGERGEQGEENRLNNPNNPSGTSPREDAPQATSSRPDNVEATGNSNRAEPAGSRLQY
jgi:hypothetical protein